jgi:hypothetical protein
MRSIEVLQLALLVIALLLVAARLRVLALRRRVVPPRRATPAPSRRATPDEWPFPDPSAPAPTGLLPSTASARRRAREHAMQGDRR